MSKTKIISAALSLISAIALGYFALLFLIQDTCLDAGGSYNTVTNLCMIDGYDQYMVINPGYFSTIFWGFAIVLLAVYLLLSFKVINGIINKVTGNT